MGQERRKFKENNTAISTIKALEQNALKDNKKKFSQSIYKLQVLIELT